VAQFFHICFPTIDDWARKASVSSNAGRVNCTALARSTLAGEVDDNLAAHLKANYRHYYHTAAALSIVGNDTTIRATKEVLVVRMEQHLWSDLARLDIALGGTGNFGSKQGSHYTHGSEHFYQNDTISTFPLFCCLLWTELEIYRDLLFAAANLKKRDKVETWQSSVERCGYSNWEDLATQCSAIQSSR
jgi:hypothetical protein